MATTNLWFSIIKHPTPNMLEKALFDAHPFQDEALEHLERRPIFTIKFPGLSGEWEMCTRIFCFRWNDDYRQEAWVEGAVRISCSLHPPSRDEENDLYLELDKKYFIAFCDFGSSKKGTEKFWFKEKLSRPEVSVQD